MPLISKARLCEVARVVHAIETVEGAQKRRLFPTRYGVTFFSIHDVWLYNAVMDSKVCLICRGHEATGEFRGNHLRARFPYLVIIDENTIGGPEPDGGGLAHPNCRCYLTRKLELEKED